MTQLKAVAITGATNNLSSPAFNSIVSAFRTTYTNGVKIVTTNKFTSSAPDFSDSTKNADNALPSLINFKYELGFSFATDNGGLFTFGTVAQNAGTDVVTYAPVDK